MTHQQPSGSSGQNLNHDALIRLIGYEPVKRRAMQRRPAVGGSNRHTVRPPHTIGLADAMDRFELLYGPDALGASRDELDLLKAARDLAAHGEDSREVTEDMHRVLVTLATVVEAVLPHVGVSPGDFWGDYAGVIAHAMEKQRDKVVALTRTLISAAKQRFESQYIGVPRGKPRGTHDGDRLAVEYSARRVASRLSSLWLTRDFAASPRDQASSEPLRPKACGGWIQSH